MRHGRFLRAATATLATLGLGAGLGAGAAGCGTGATAPPAAGVAGGSGVSTAPMIPPLDAAAPSAFQTATFALG